jgi:uncharacterized protein (DUF58 family)
MIAPTNRLIWFIAAVVLPAAAIGGLVPRAFGVCIVVAAAALTAAIVDVLFAPGRLRGVAVRLPELVRTTLDREAAIALRIEWNAAGEIACPTNAKVGQAFSLPSCLRLRLGLAMPVEFEAKDELLNVDVQSQLAQVDWFCTPRKRGSYRIDACYFETASALGFWAVRGQTQAACEIRVYPNLAEASRQIAAAFLNRGDAGGHTQRQIGKGREFEKLREYEQGDTYDDIHWKTTAKRGRPITKVFQLERTQEVYAVIDSSRLTARDDLLERYVNSALILGAVVERQSDLFGLVTFSDRVHGFVRARNGKAHFNACRESLYTLQPRLVSPDFDELGAFLRTRLRRRALIVVLTALDDPALAESFLRNASLLRRKHVVLAAMVAPPEAEPLFTRDTVESEADIYRALGGHLAWRKIKELERALDRQGVRLILLDPLRIASQVTAAYRTVKQRQLL